MITTQTETQDVASPLAVSPVPLGGGEGFLSPDKTERDTAVSSFSGRCWDRGAALLLYVDVFLLGLL